MRSAGRRSDGPPSLGPRGEGWLGLQYLLFAAVGICCSLGPRWPGAVRTAVLVIGVVGLFLGGAMLVAGIFSLGSSFRPLPEPLPGAELKQGYVYGLVRHPIYGAIMLLAFAAAAVFSPLALLPAALIVPLHAAKAQVEERWLTEAHPEYSDYRRRVRRRFIPGLL